MATTYDNTLMGSEGDDTLVATPGANLIDAGAGNDTIFALEGINTIEFGVGSGMDTASQILKVSFRGPTSSFSIINLSLL